MELKQLRSFAAVVKYGSFTKAAEKTFISQPTISTHVRSLEEELHVTLIRRTTKNIEVTKKGMELYECVSHMLELQDNLMQRWKEEKKTIIHIGASTIPSAYILPEILPEFGKEYPEIYFTVHQSDSAVVREGVKNGLYDIGLVGMEVQEDDIICKPFYKDKMVLVTPVTPYYIKLSEEKETPIVQLLKEPIILREEGSGSLKSANYFLDSIHVAEKDLKITARVNDQESIKNLVAGGLGISIMSGKAVQNFVEEKRLLQFELSSEAASRKLYLIYSTRKTISEAVQKFYDFVLSFYCPFLDK